MRIGIFSDTHCGFKYGEERGEDAHQEHRLCAGHVPDQGRRDGKADDEVGADRALAPG